MGRIGHNYWIDRVLFAEGIVILRREIVTLAHSDILQLPTVPFKLVDAPGVGNYISVVSVSASFQRLASYTNLDNQSYLSVALNPPNGPDVLTPFQQKNGAGEGSLSEFLAGVHNDILPAWSRFAQTTVPSAPTNDVAAPQIPFLKSLVENQGLYLYAKNGNAGNFTGGHTSNFIKMAVSYIIEQTF